MPYDNQSGQAVCARTRFINNFAEKMGMEYREANQFLDNLVSSKASASESDGELIELMLAININAKLHNLQGEAGFQRFKFMLNNGSRRASRLAKMWMDQKISFTEMMGSF